MSLVRAVALAVVFGLVSLPVVVVALQAMLTGSRSGPPAEPLIVALEAAVGAVVLGALVGGSLGYLLLRAMWRSLAVFATVAVAWTSAIVGTAVVPAVLGTSATLVETCIDSCNATLAIGSATDVTQAFGVAIRSIVFAPIAIVAQPAAWIALVLLALVLAYGLRGAAERKQLAVRDGAVATLAAVPFAVSVVQPGAVIAFAALVVGATTWTQLVRPLSVPALAADSPIDASGKREPDATR